MGVLLVVEQIKSPNAFFTSLKNQVWFPTPIKLFQLMDSQATAFFLL